jgi:hypothetical protein
MCTWSTDRLGRAETMTLSHAQKRESYGLRFTVPGTGVSFCPSQVDRMAAECPIPESPPLRLVEYFIVISCKMDTPSPVPLLGDGTASTEEDGTHTNKTTSITSNVFNSEEDNKTLDARNEQNEDDHSEYFIADGLKDNGRLQVLDETQLLQRLNLRVVHLPPDEGEDDDEDDDGPEWTVDHCPIPCPQNASSPTGIPDEMDFSTNNLLDQQCSTSNVIIQKDSCLSSPSHVHTPDLLAHMASKDAATVSSARCKKTKHASYYFNSRRVPVIADFNPMEPLIQSYNDSSHSTPLLPIHNNEEDEEFSSDLSTHSHDSQPGPKDTLRQGSSSIGSHSHSSRSIDTAQAQTQLDPCGIPSPIPAMDSYESENIRIPTSISSLHLDTESHTLSFTPVITARYPFIDRPDHPLNSMVTQFCFPNSTSIHLSTEYRYPRLHHFVLTDDKGAKLYGTCLTVWEDYDPEEHPSKIHPPISTMIPDTQDESSPHDGNVELYIQNPAKSDTKFYLPKAICILSSWPYLEAFGQYISSLYQFATMTNAMNIPLERYVMNICEEVPVPHPGSFEVQVKVWRILFLC